MGALLAVLARLDPVGVVTARERTIFAAENADWMQVVLNQGPPCFHIEERGNFCLRAQRLAGHVDGGEYPEHTFVSLVDLLRSDPAIVKSVDVSPTIGSALRSSSMSGTKDGE